MGVSINDWYSNGHALCSATRWFLCTCLWCRLPSEAFKNKDRKLAHIFNSTLLYKDDVLSLSNSRFGDYLHYIYAMSLELMMLRILNALLLIFTFTLKSKLKTKPYDKRDDLNFSIVNLPSSVAIFQHDQRMNF
jgi:hypothetical protein